MSLARLFVLTALTVAAAPFSRAGVYLKIAGLYNQPSDVSISNVSAFRASLKNNVGISGALGYKFTLFRVEAELQHLRSGTEGEETSGTSLGGIGRTVGTLKETSGFANGYVDFPSFFGLAPYIGAGLGYARVNIDNLARTRNDVPVYQFSGREAVFGYQGMVGLQYHLFGQATLNAGFRLVKHEDVAVRDVLASAQRSLSLGHNRVFELGVAIGF
jgi:opacity protein-like surface antigen